MLKKNRDRLHTIGGGNPMQTIKARGCGGSASSLHACGFSCVKDNGLRQQHRPLPFSTTTTTTTLHP